jgi:hypothetical protein
VKKRFDKGKCSIKIRPVRRGIIIRGEAKLLNFWAPKGLLPVLDEGVRKLDSDRSKFIRIAIREKLAREGIRLTSEN